jgi:hypothetical protein
MAGLSDLILLRRANNGDTDPFKDNPELKEWLNKAYDKRGPYLERNVKPSNTNVKPSNTRVIKEDLEEGAPSKDVSTEVQPLLTNTPLLTTNYFEDILDLNTFKELYQGHNPTSKTQRQENFKSAFNKAINDKEINDNIIKNNVVNIIDSIIPAFPELRKHNAFNRDAFIKLAKYESAGGSQLVNTKTNDYGMFQLNEKNIKKIFGTTKDFVNDTYTTDDKRNGIIPKGKNINDRITDKEVIKRANKAKETFDGSFSRYFGNNASYVTGYSPNELKEMYAKNPKSFVREFLKDNHKINLGIAIAGSIMPNLDAQKNKKKKSGGMVERNYYDYAPRNI